MPGTKLEQHAGSDKAWVWSAVDFAAGEQKIEMFCLRFGTPEKAAAFETKFKECMDINQKILGEVATASKAKDEAAGDELAKDVEEKAAVKDKEQEDA